MPNDKNHLYSSADVNFDAKRKDKINSQQQYSRFSVSDTNSIIDIANLSQNPALQNLTKTQIGNPYNDTFGTTGPILQTIFFDVLGNNYSFFNLTGDTVFALSELPQGRFIEYTTDITVGAVASPISITFEQVLNPPILPGEAGDHYILKFIAVRRAFDDGDETDADTPIIAEYIGGSIGSAGGTISVATFELEDPQTTTAVVNFVEQANLGSGIFKTPTDGVIKLSGSVFQLFSSLAVSGVNADTTGQWESSDAEGGSFTAIGIPSVIDNPLQDTAPISTAFVDATDADVFVRLSATLSSATITTDGTWAQIFSLGGGSSGATGNFLPTAGGVMVGPIAFEPQDATLATHRLDISQARLTAINFRM